MNLQNSRMARTVDQMLHDDGGETEALVHMKTDKLISFMFTYRYALHVILDISHLSCLPFADNYNRRRKKRG